MIATALLAILCSGTIILALCNRDPKRLRTTDGKLTAMAPRHRRLLVAVACIPGIACLLLGNTAAFLMWLGGCALLGWALAGYYGARRSERSSRRADVR